MTINDFENLILSELKSVTEKILENNATPNICSRVGISFIKKIDSTATISGVKINHKLTVTAGRRESPTN